MHPPPQKPAELLSRQTALKTSLRPANQLSSQKLLISGVFFPFHGVLGAFTLLLLLLCGASARGGLQGSQRAGYGENRSAAVDCHAEPQKGKCFGASLVEVCRRISWLQCGHGAGRAARSQAAPQDQVTSSSKLEDSRVRLLLPRDSLT